MSLSDQSINMATTNDDQEPPNKKQKREVIVCQICINTVDGDDYLRPCRDCQGTWCYTCIKKSFKTALSNHEDFPARCCKVFYHGLAEGILKPAKLTRYKARFEENNASNPIYCPVPTCSTFISLRRQQAVNDKITCPACGGEACTKCKNVAADGHDCSRNDSKELAEKFGYKMCPRCGTGIMRLYGCAHMQCSCGAHFCWYCQRPMDVCESEGCNNEEDDGDDAPNNNDDNATAREAPPATEPAAGATTTVESNPTESVTADATANPPTSTEPAAAIADTTTDSATPTSRPSTEVETFVNLDDPDGVDWEGMDLDLNDEPDADDRTMFGCHHEFREFGVDAMPDKWLKGLNKLKGVQIECMSCFKPIKVNGTLANEKESKKKNKASRKLLMAYDCEVCGVIVCWGCREEVMRWAKPT